MTPPLKSPPHNSPNTSVPSHLHVRILPPWWAVRRRHVSIGLVIKQVESLFAGARDVGNASTISHGELELHVHAEHASAWDEVRPKPVVLVGLQDVTHLVRSDWVHGVVVTADLLPLRGKSACHEKTERQDPILHFYIPGLHFELFEDVLVI